MASLSKKEQKLIEVLINIKEESTKTALSEYIRNIYPITFVEGANYIYAAGDIPIALCAHMDTVWEDYKGEKKHLYYDKQKDCMWCPEGAGFDDKIGVFLIIKILESGLRPHIILTLGEEKGGIGASELASLECPFLDLRYCIELDRRGTTDCVFYSCNNPEFEEYVESFGFKTDWGSFTDICYFCPKWGMAGVNLSVGYFDEHTTNERLYVRAMLRTLSKVKKMLTAEEIPFFQYIPYSYSSKYSRYFGSVNLPYSSGPSEDDYDYWDDDYYYYGYGRYHSFGRKCSCCNKVVDEDLVLPYQLKDGSNAYVCTDCLDKDEVCWCDYCHEAYQGDLNDYEYICPACKELIYSGAESRFKERISGADSGSSLVVTGTDNPSGSDESNRLN